MTIEMGWNTGARSVWRETKKITYFRRLHYLDSYQLFLAILCEEGPVTEAIEHVVWHSCGYSIPDLQDAINEYAGTGRAKVPRNMERSPELESIVKRAKDLAAIEGLIEAGTEHLMWGIFNEKGALSKILAEYGLEPSSFDYVMRALENLHG